MTAAVAMGAAYLVALTSAVRVALIQPTGSTRMVWVLSILMMTARVAVFCVPWLWSAEAILVLAFGLAAHLYGVPALRHARYSEADLRERIQEESAKSEHVAQVIRGILKTWFYQDLIEDDCDSGFIRVNIDGEIVKAAGGGSNPHWAEDRIKLWHEVAWRAHAAALSGEVARYEDHDNGLHYWVQVRPWRESGQIIGSRFSFMSRPRTAKLTEGSDAEP